MTFCARQSAQHTHVGITLGGLVNISSYHGLMGDDHVISRFQHGTVEMSKDDAILYQRELLAALATHGWRPDVSGSAADLEAGA